MELYRRVIDLADRFGLGLWTVLVDERPTENGGDDAHAEVSIESGEARITFWKSFYALEEHEQLHVIVHELVHIVFHSVDEMIEALPELGDQFVETMHRLDPDAARAVYELFCTQLLQNYEQRAEKLVDSIASMVLRANDLGLER